VKRITDTSLPVKKESRVVKNITITKNWYIEVA